MWANVQTETTYHIILLPVVFSWKKMKLKWYKINRQLWEDSGLLHFSWRLWSECDGVREQQWECTSLQNKPMQKNEREEWWTIKWKEGESISEWSRKRNNKGNEWPWLTAACRLDLNATTRRDQTVAFCWLFSLDRWSAAKSFLCCRKKSLPLGKIPWDLERAHNDWEPQKMSYQWSLWEKSSFETKTSPPLGIESYGVCVWWCAVKIYTTNIKLKALPQVSLSRHCLVQILNNLIAKM